MSQHLEEGEGRNVDRFGVIDQVRIILSVISMSEQNSHFHLGKLVEVDGKTYGSRLGAAQLASRAA